MWAMTKQQEPPHPAQLELEQAVVQAIRVFEEKSKRLVMGFSLTRANRSYLQVSALITPQLSAKRSPADAERSVESTAARP
jgi:hypothetical protein